MPIGPEKQEQVQRRRAQVVQWRLVGMTFEQIGQRLDPPVTMQMAHRLWKDAMRAIVADDVEELRKTEDARLDMLITQAVQVMRTKHYVLHMGEVVKRPNPVTGMLEELIDDGPVLSAVATIQRLAESKRKLWGVDVPQKVEHEWSVSKVDQELEKLKQELADLPMPTAEELIEPGGG